MDAAQAKDFQACTCYGIKLAEEAEDWAARDHLLRLVRAWLAAAQDVQSAVDEVRLTLRDWHECARVQRRKHFKQRSPPPLPRPMPNRQLTNANLLSGKS
jgi:hypothetical protein